MCCGEPSDPGTRPRLQPTVGLCCPRHLLKAEHALHPGCRADPVLGTGRGHLLHPGRADPRVVGGGHRRAGAEPVQRSTKPLSTTRPGLVGPCPGLDGTRRPGRPTGPDLAQVGSLQATGGTPPSAGARSLAGPAQATQAAAAVDYLLDRSPAKGAMTISTRRFICRPDARSLLATGWASP